MKLHNIHIQQCTFGKEHKDKNNDTFIPETASGNRSEWEESKKITSQKKKKRKENTDKERDQEEESKRRRRRVVRAQGHPDPVLSGTCSAYKLKEKPKVCHRVIFPLSTSWGLSLDSDHVPAAKGHVVLKHCLTWLEHILANVLARVSQSRQQKK